MNVIVSTEQKIYHKPNCFYVEKIKPQNRMSLSQTEAEKNRYHCCQYCGGLRGEVRTNDRISLWQQEHQIAITFDKKTDTLYVRTAIGCWKIFFKEELSAYLLYHKNTYHPKLSSKAIIHGEYHRQRDVKPTTSLHHLINYIVAYDRAKVIMMDDYRKLPKSTAKQKKYYKRVENKKKRQEEKQAYLRLTHLFKSIEAQDPSMQQYAFC